MRMNIKHKWFVASALAFLASGCFNKDNPGYIPTRTAPVTLTGIPSDISANDQLRMRSAMSVPLSQGAQVVVTVPQPQSKPPKIYLATNFPDGTKMLVAIVRMKLLASGKPLEPIRRYTWTESKLAQITDIQPIGQPSGVTLEPGPYRVLITNAVESSQMNDAAKAAIHSLPNYTKAVPFFFGNAKRKFFVSQDVVF